MAMAIAMAMCHTWSNISSREAINSKGTSASTLAVTVVTAAYGTAAVDPGLGKKECMYLTQDRIYWEI